MDPAAPQLRVAPDLLEELDMVMDVPDTVPEERVADLQGFRRNT